MPNIAIAIAIDGPAGAGKGTLAKHLALHYRMKYLDSGALYRAVGLRVLLNEGDPGHEEDAVTAAKTLDFDFRHMGENTFHAFINGQDVEHRLRTAEVGNAASKVAFFSGVRNALKEFQVNFITHWRNNKGVILDGRDIGTVICPDAELKLFLDADPKVRAQRRLQELRSAGKNVTFDEIHLQILERDARDRGRKDAPLKPADDAILIDTSHLPADEVFDLVCRLVEKRTQQAG